MRSAMSFKGHPIHPALIPYPFAFLTGAFLFDAVGVLLERPGLWATGSHLGLAGVASALLAAGAGAVDYFRTVPPKSTAKERATKHGLANLTATALFAAAWVARGGGDPLSAPLLLGMEGFGSALLVVGGWMGGALSFRNQIGVDHRYAGAGKWKQVRLKSQPGVALVVADRDELEPNQMKLLEVDGRRIVLGRTESGYVAFDDRCTHRGGSLAGGAMICGTVQCPWHGSQFDVKDGRVRAGPTGQPIATYRVQERDGKVVLEV